jgi:hypothetical protein
MATVTQASAETTIDRTDTSVLLGIGFGVWAAATLLVRVLGPALLAPETPLVTIALYLSMLPAMVAVALVAFRVRSVAGTDRVLAATLLVLPGMVLDSLVVSFFGTAFPTVDPAMAGPFGGILLFAYATVLLTGSLAR